MKTWVLCLLFWLSMSCLGSEVELIRHAVKLGNDGKTTYISTNSASMPFYLIAADLKLSSMVGAKRDTNVISSSRMALITQYVPSIRLTNGKVPPAGYLRLSGRYAVLNGRILTLTDFKMDISEEEASRDEVLSVQFASLTFEVSEALAAEVEVLRPQ